MDFEDSTCPLSFSLTWGPASLHIPSLLLSHSLHPPLGLLSGASAGQFQMTLLCAPCHGSAWPAFLTDTGVSPEGTPGALLKS